MSNPAELEELARALSNVNASRYLSVAGLVVLLYDMMLTQADEVRLIWGTPWCTVKILYFINRLVTPVFQITAAYHLSGHHPPLSESWCKSYLIVFSVAEIIGLAIINYLLLLRVRALYYENRLLMIPLHIFFAVAEIVVIVIVSLNMVGVTSEISYDLHLGICMPKDFNSFMGGTFLAPLAFETVVFILTMRKGWENAQFFRNGNNTSALYTMFRDGVFYFIVLMVVRVFNAIIWLTLPKSFFYLGALFIWSFASAIYTRLFLNLRGVLGGPDLDDTKSLFDNCGRMNRHRTSGSYHSQADRSWVVGRRHSSTGGAGGDDDWDAVIEGFSHISTTDFQEGNEGVLKVPVETDTQPAFANNLDKLT